MFAGDQRSIAQPGCETLPPRSDVGFLYSTVITGKGVSHVCMVNAGDTPFWRTLTRLSRLWSNEETVRS